MGDDPTGVQTVYAVPVYTLMDLDSLAAIFNEECQMVFILTNSRALTVHDTEEMHRLLIRNLVSMNLDYGKDYLIISRSDSTLRGHYPLETQVIYEEISEKDHYVFILHVNLFAPVIRKKTLIFPPKFPMAWSK